jgi:glycosyltransferase involved in cell wall biosynthesis
VGKSSRLHIIQALASRGEGGRELAPLLLASGLRKRNHKASIWADPDSFLGKKASAKGFLTQPFRFYGYFRKSGIQEIVKAVRKESPDLIHLHHTRDLWAVVPALALAGWKGPLVLSKHVSSAVRKKDFLHRRLYRRIDLMMTCSEFIRRNVLETCPIEPEKVKTSFMPVDLKEFHFKAAARKKLRKDWGLEKNDIIGMVSRLTPKKGHELFLHAAAKLLAKRPNARFRVAGKYSAEEEWYYEILLALRKKLGLEKAVTYEGYISDVSGFLSAADLMVHMAEAESFGMAVVEALACKRPVIVRRGGGLAEILESTPGKVQGGLVLDTDDPQEWADTLDKVLGSKALMAKFQRETLKIASRFSLEPWVDRHLQWYQQLLDGKPPTP